LGIIAYFIFVDKVSVGSWSSKEFLQIVLGLIQEIRGIILLIDNSKEVLSISCYIKKFL